MGQIVFLLEMIGTIALFIVNYNRKRFSCRKVFLLYEKTMTIMNAVGLGVFTTLGIEIAYENGYQNEIFFCISWNLNRRRRNLSCDCHPAFGSYVSQESA